MALLSWVTRPPWIQLALGCSRAELGSQSGRISPLLQKSCYETDRDSSPRVRAAATAGATGQQQHQVRDDEPEEVNIGMRRSANLRIFGGLNGITSRCARSNTAVVGIRCFSDRSSRRHQEEQQPQEDQVAPPLSNHDYIGPPDPVSNLRRVRFHIPSDESALHKKYRLLQEDTQRWNDDFWRKHNQEFAKGKEDFIARALKERYPDEPTRDTVPAEEMSEFYKTHLDAKWRDHLEYNLAWQSRNFRILGLSVLVTLEKLIRR